MGCAASIISAFDTKLVIDLDHLFLTKIIGNGGFGTVYSAVHLDYASWYAVKKVDKRALLKEKTGVSMIMVSHMPPLVCIILISVIIQYYLLNKYIIIHHWYKNIKCDCYLGYFYVQLWLI